MHYSGKIPLLAIQEDMQRAGAGIFKSIPPEREKTDPVVLMGHGTHHPSNAFYAALIFPFSSRIPTYSWGRWRVTLKSTTSKHG
jgi:cobalamin biosynthesis Co2+ chelatase CbiK